MRAAVIGTQWGRVHVSALREADVEVVALAGDSAGPVAAAAHELGVGVALTDLAPLARLGLDLVCVATPPATHVGVIAALPDVPVLCEKPAVGLSPVRPLPPGRVAPTWVNYAFAHLDVAQRAEAALDRLGTITAARVTTDFDLPGAPRQGRQMLTELVSHPWSWLVHVLGPPAAAARGLASAPLGPAVGPGAGDDPGAGDAALDARCGPVPTRVGCRHHPGLGGIRHEVEVIGDGATLRLRGSFEVGRPWRFEAPELWRGAGRAALLGEAEVGPPDPWYRANARSIGAVVAVLRGGPTHPALVPWEAAVQLDRVAQRLVAAAPA